MVISLICDVITLLHDFIKLFSVAIQWSMQSTSIRPSSRFLVVVVVVEGGGCSEVNKRTMTSSQVHCGQDHSVVVLQDGSVMTCGIGSDGQTGYHLFVVMTTFLSLRLSNNHGLAAPAR